VGGGRGVLGALIIEIQHCVVDHEYEIDGRKYLFYWLVYELSSKTWDNGGNQKVYWVN
jgi:hypothetical protein